MQSIADGVLFGATYALLGIGFTLVFGVMHKINLSYAAASIGAAYASLLVLVGRQGAARFWYSSLAAAPAGVIGGAGLSRLLPLHSARQSARHADVDGRPAAADRRDHRAHDGGHPAATIPALFSDVIVSAGPFNLRGDLMFVFALGCLCMLLLLRAALPHQARPRDARRLAAAGRGAAVRHQHHRASTFSPSSITGVVGGIAGAMIGAAIGMLSPLLSLPLTVKGLIVTVIGGLGSIPGAIIAGLLVGGLENLFQFFRGVTERDLYVMLLLFAFLVFRPGGIFCPAGWAGLTETRMDFYLGLAQIIGVHTLLGLSAYCVLLTGQVSLAQAGFFAIGAYVAGMLTVLARLADRPGALVAARFVAGAVACAVGFPALRVKGLMLVVATLAFGEAVRLFFFNFNYQVARRRSASSARMAAKVSGRSAISRSTAGRRST